MKAILSHIIKTLIEKQALLEDKSYRVELYPNGVYYYCQKDYRCNLNGTEYLNGTLAREEAKELYNIDENTPYLLFMYNTQFLDKGDSGSFLIIENPCKEDERCVFEAGFSRNGKLLFGDFYCERYEFSKEVKKLLRSYNRKGIFVSNN